MKAIRIDTPGPAESLVLQDLPAPEPAPGEVRVEVRAVGVNRADVMQREGRYPAPPGASSVLGLELSGVLLNKTSSIPEGARVMALVGGGAYATEAAVPAGQLMPVPEGLSFEEAAAIPEAFLTAYHNLYDLGDIQSGQTVLIHAAGSGVGTAAIQMVRAAGARVIGTVRTSDKMERCHQLGAEVMICTSEESFAERVQAETGGRGVDLVLDFIGAAYWQDNIRSLARGGRMALIGTLGGSRAEIEIGLLMRNRLRVEGSTLRAQSPEEKAKLVERGGQVILKGLREGNLRPVLDKVFPLSDAAGAHRYMEAGKGFGKIVLAVELSSTMRDGSIP